MNRVCCRVANFTVFWLFLPPAKRMGFSPEISPPRTPRRFIAAFSTTSDSGGLVLLTLRCGWQPAPRSHGPVKSDPVCRCRVCPPSVTLTTFFRRDGFTPRHCCCSDFKLLFMPRAPFASQAKRQQLPATRAPVSYYLRKYAATPL